MESSTPHLTGADECSGGLVADEPSRVESIRDLDLCAGLQRQQGRAHRRVLQNPVPPELPSFSSRSKASLRAAICLAPTAGAGMAPTFAAICTGHKARSGRCGRRDPDRPRYFQAKPNADEGHLRLRRRPTEQARCAIKAPGVADGVRRLAGGMARAYRYQAGRNLSSLAARPAERLAYN